MEDFFKDTEKTEVRYNSLWMSAHPWAGRNVDFNLHTWRKRGGDVPLRITGENLSNFLIFGKDNLHEN